MAGSFDWNADRGAFLHNFRVGVVAIARGKPYIGEPIDALRLAWLEAVETWIRSQNRGGGGGINNGPKFMTFLLRRLEEIDGLLCESWHPDQREDGVPVHVTWVVRSLISDISDWRIKD